MRRAQHSPLLVPSFLLALLLIAAPHVAGGDEGSSKEKPDPSPAVDLPEGRTISADSDLEKRIRTALDEPANVQYLDTQLSDIANDLSLRYKIPVRLETGALTAEGKGPDTLFSFSTREGSLRNALRSMLRLESLTFAVRHDALFVTTLTHAETLESTRVYQVHDLVVMPNDATAAHPDFDSLVEVITSAVLPETWRVAGGTIGDIRSFRAPGVLALVVTHTEEGHEQIESLLKTLRAAREPKVQELQRHAKPIEEQVPKAKAKQVHGSASRPPTNGGSGMF